MYFRLRDRVEILNLRKFILEELHNGHACLMKNFAWSYVWWKIIVQDIEELV